MLNLASKFWFRFCWKCETGSSLFKYTTAEKDLDFIQRRSQSVSKTKNLNYRSTLWESSGPVRRRCWQRAVQRWPPAQPDPAGRWLWYHGRRNSRPRRRRCGRATRWGRGWGTKRGRQRTGRTGPGRVQPAQADAPWSAPQTQTGPPELLWESNTEKCVCVRLSHIHVLVCTFGLLFMSSTTRWQQMCCYSNLCAQCIFLCCTTCYNVLQEKLNLTIILELLRHPKIISHLFKE